MVDSCLLKNLINIDLRNQYPPDFHEPIMKRALEKIMDVEEKKEEADFACNSDLQREEGKETKEKAKKTLIFISSE